MSKKLYIFLLTSICICVTSFFGFWIYQNIKISDANNPPVYNIEVVLKSLENTTNFWDLIKDGLLLGEKEFNVRCTLRAPKSEADIEGQKELMNDAIKRAPNGIILAACDYEELSTLCDIALKKGIKVVTIDSDVKEESRKAFVGTDNYEMGKKLAGLTTEAIGNISSFGIISHVKNTATATQRLKGFKENIQSYNSRIGGLEYCNGDENTAKAQTKKMIEKNPNIRCMIGLNENSSRGIAMALSELNLTKKVYLVACDSSEKQVKYLENGTIYAGVVQNPFAMGYLSIKTMVSIIENKKYDTTNYTDAGIVRTKDLNNPKYQQLIFPFSK